MEASGLPRFHLPAPTAKDAAGHEGKATLTLTLNKATITVDPAFLSSAVYPVTIDPIINYVLQSSGTDFTYDNYAPLSELKHVAANQTPFSTSDYTFDNVRNRTQRVQGPTGSQITSTYMYDRADRILTSGTGGAITDTVDANGNLKARTGGAVNDSFSYDQANRLTSATTSAGSGTYTYDGDGKRTSKRVSGVTTNYVWDVGGGLPRLLSDEYGVRTSFQGTDDQPFQYTGGQVDPESGFVYLHSRYYDPPTGRFLTRDAFPGVVPDPASLNRFVYTGNNPINRMDPSGQDSLDDFQSWVEANILRPIAAPAYSDAPAGVDGDLDALIAQVQQEGTGSALPAVEVTENVVDVASIMLPGPGSANALRVIPQLLQGERKWGLIHVVLEHWHSAGSVGTSKFAADIGARALKRLLAEAANIPGAVWRLEGNSTVLEADVGRVIGTTATGAETSRIRVVMDQTGRVITAYPIP